MGQDLLNRLIYGIMEGNLNKFVNPANLLSQQYNLQAQNHSHYNKSWLCVCVSIH